MTERERAHPPSLPTSPTEKSPPDSTLTSNGDITTENKTNNVEITEGLDPEGQETVNDTANEVEDSPKTDKVEDISEKVWIAMLIWKFFIHKFLLENW